MLLTPKTIAPIAANTATSDSPRIGFPKIESEARTTKIPKINSNTQLPTLAFLISTDKMIIEIPSNKKPKPQINHKKLAANAGFVSMQTPARITRICNASFSPHKLMYFRSTIVKIAQKIPDTRK